MPEEIEMFDLDVDRWDDEKYTMRADEVGPMTELVNAVVRALQTKGRRGLFFNNSYALLAEKLRAIDWTRSDEPPKDATGAVCAS